MLWPEYAQSKRSEGVLDKTLSDYMSCLKSFVTWKIVHYGEETVTTEIIKEFLSTLTCSSFRRRNHWIALKSFYSWVVAAHWRSDNPMDAIKAPRVEAKIIEVYQDDEIDRVLNWIMHKRRGRFAMRDVALVSLYHRTGVRARELLRVRFDDVDTDRMTIKIHGKGSKERLIAYDESCRIPLELWMHKNVVDIIFPIGINRVEDIFKQACDEAQVKYRGVHVLRHTFATNYLRHGGNPLDLMYLLGHSSLYMTNYYSQWLASERAIENYHRLNVVQ